MALYSYQSITDVATEAIDAIAREPQDNAICDRASLLGMACSILWSWELLVGEDACRSDAARMIAAIRSIQAETPIPDTENSSAMPHASEVRERLA
jgi:hypothetical protein